MWELWQSARKFGLGHCDLPTQIWNVAVMLRIVALNIERGSKSIHKVVYVYTAASAMCYIFSYQVCMLSFVFVGCRKTRDLLSGVLAISVSLTSHIGITKLLFMYIYQNKVQSAVAGYVNYARLPSAPSTADLMAATMRTVKIRAMIFWAIVMGNGILYSMQPVLMPEKSALYDDHVRFGVKYIFGIPSNYAVITSLVITGINVYFICYVVSNITGLLIITTGYSEAKLLTLGQEMRELWSDANQHYRKNFNPKQTVGTLDENANKELNDYLKHRLHLIAQSHVINIDLVKKIEAIFRVAIAIEFILLSAALIADLLGGLEETYIILPFASIQVSMDCYIGQKLMDANAVFEYSVYDCGWENFNVQNRKTVLLILTMSQRTLSLSAGGIATLSFMCLMSLVKSVYSAYTTLRSTME